ncbi:MAG: A24 family peptidase [Methylococcales bacterium]
MTLFYVLEHNPLFFILLSGLFGLLVGSFINVVVYRLPLMMERNWRRECTEFLELPEPEDNKPALNLLTPGSCCPACNHTIAPWENIPILSYLFLKGRCAHCNTKISARYPLVELFTSVCTALAAWHFGFGWEALLAFILVWSLISLSLIDIDHQLLPDSITLPLLWLGLFISVFGIYTDSPASIIGAVAGYLTLWLVYHLFKLVTGKEGMGYGDFKLLSLLGAWMGWQFLPLIILLSSLVGAIIGISMMLFFNHDRQTPIPFGPYLAAAGFIALIWGERIIAYYLTSIGIPG